MRSLWSHLCMLVLYCGLVILASRLLDAVLWYTRGVTHTHVIDPRLALGVRTLKSLLDVRGVSHAGCVEKKELADLVINSGDVAYSELEELGSNAHPSSTLRLSSASHFSGGAHLYEEVEDTKDSVWLVQVTPEGSEPPLDDYSWRVVCDRLAPFAIRTGVFDCRLDRRLCASKGWHEPLLLLALPRGTRPKDKVLMQIFKSTRPQAIVSWVQEQLSYRVEHLSNIEEVKNVWLNPNSTQQYSQTAVKVLLLTHLLQPPLFLAALGVKFSGRIQFGMLSVKKEDKEAVKEQLNIDKIPNYVIITPERVFIYGERRQEHFNFKSMHTFLRSIQPEINDAFLLTLTLVNFVALLKACTKRTLFRIALTFILLNCTLLAGWLVFFTVSRFAFIKSFSDFFLHVARVITISDFGSTVKADWLIINQFPCVLLPLTLTFFIFIRNAFLEPLDNESSVETSWWSFFSLDSYILNCLFRPMTTFSQPLLTNEFEFEEMLIERLAVPNLWLTPMVNGDYLKDLPRWRFRGWQNINTSILSRELIDEIAHRETLNQNQDPRNWFGDSYELSSSETDCDERHSMSVIEDPPSLMLRVMECAICLDQYAYGSLLCGLPCGHSYHDKCIMTWLLRDNHNCPICRWPAYKLQRRLLKQT